MQTSIVENYCSRMIIRINDIKNEQKNKGSGGGTGIGTDGDSGFGSGMGGGEGDIDGTLGNVNGSGDTTSTNTTVNPLNYCPVSVKRDRWDYSLRYIDGRGIESKRYDDVDSYTTAIVKLQKDKKIDCPEVYIV